jgi:hypothetical protein
MKRIYLAAQAHVRRQHTEYPDLIVYERMAPDLARRIVIPTVNRILKTWKEKPVNIGGGEPYSVRYVPFDTRLLQWLRGDPERMYALSVPFLVAGQIKHKSSPRHKVEGGEMRELRGAINHSRSQFHVGYFVTNTAFKPSAKWLSENESKLARLRGMLDLRRWLNDDFQNEEEWREFPPEIEVGYGQKIPIWQDSRGV